MNTHRADVVVIGGGAAGTAAALSAADAGAKVQLVARSPGATALSSGAVDLAADPMESADTPWTDRATAGELFRRQRLATPTHPLTLARINGDQAFALLEMFCQRLALLAPPERDRSPRILINDIGTLKTTTCCQRTMVGGDLTGLVGERLGVVGFAGYPHHVPQTQASTLQRLARRGGVELSAVPLELELLTQRGQQLEHPRALALRLQSDRTLDRLETSLRRAVDDHGLTRLALPPVMGLDGWASVMERVDQVVPAFETLASQLSVPGLRLQAALDAALARASVRISRAAAVNHRNDGKVLRQLELADGSTLDARAFVLASGRFVGGGITHSTVLGESLLGLPVWAGDDGPDLRHAGLLMGRKVAGPHPLMAAGLRVDPNLQPLGHGRGTAFDNLWAAGSVLGGYDYIVGRDGLGTALISGDLAGKRAADLAGA